MHVSQKVVEGLNQSCGRSIDKTPSLTDSLYPLLNGSSSQPVGAGWGWAATQQPERFWSLATNQLFPSQLPEETVLSHTRFGQVT